MELNTDSQHFSSPGHVNGAGAAQVLNKAPQTRIHFQAHWYGSVEGQCVTVRLQTLSVDYCMDCIRNASDLSSCLGALRTLFLLYLERVRRGSCEEASPVSGSLLTMAHLKQGLVA